MTTLNKIKIGEKAKVKKINSKVNKRLVEMGILPGAALEVVRVAPLGDPIDIKIKGYHLTLRKEEAQEITVELL